MRRGLLGLLVLAAAGLTACGGDEPTRDDAATVSAMLRSGASVQRAIGPLYSCVPERRGCYTRNGPKAVKAVEREAQRFDEVLAETDNTCLKEVGRLYRRSLDFYAAAGRAAARGNTGAVDRQLARSSDAEIGYLQELDGCGFVQGQAAVVSAELRHVNADVLRTSQRLLACAKPPCVEKFAHRLEQLGRRGTSLVDRYASTMGDDAPDCLGKALSVFKEYFGPLEQLGTAVRTGDVEEARAGARVDRLAIRVQEDMAACVESSAA